MPFHRASDMNNRPRPTTPKSKQTREAGVTPRPRVEATLLSLRWTWSGMAMAATLLLPVSAFASDAAPAEEESLPVPTLSIDRLPPNASWDLAVTLSYGVLPHFEDVVPTWVGFGFRGAWGPNFGTHRVGPALQLLTEGPMGVHTSLLVEPSIAWDYVGEANVLVGAGVGWALAYNSRADIIVPERSVTTLPSISGRFGWSETWTRVGRRLFVFVEPKLRIATEDIGAKGDSPFHPVVSINLGSGQGY